MTANVVIDTLCNRCEKSCTKKGDVYGAHVTFSTGFMSESFSDCLTFTFDLCEECLLDLFKGFKVQPACLETPGQLTVDYDANRTPNAILSADDIA